MTDAILFEKKSKIVTLTLNRPETRNSLSSEEMYDGFEDACDRIGRDQGVSCVILTGAGSAFSSGGNVKDMAKRAKLSKAKPAHTRHMYREGIQRIPLALHRLEVPVIAAVNGPAIGAGCDLTLMCDIRIASDRARFAESFVKMGLIPGDGGAWFLPRLIGPSRAAEMIFTGDMIDAATALEYGLVSRVVPHDALMSEAQALARRIVVNPPQTLRMGKRLLRESEFSRLDSLLDMSAALQALSQTLDDHGEAANAFVERRKPRFTGK